MRTTTALAARSGFRIHAVTCRDDHTGWSGPESRGRFGFVLVRRGRFRWSSDGRVVDVDTTVGYVSVPGAEERFAHPAGGDVCTSIEVGPELWRGAVGPALYVDARVDLAHSRLLTAVRGGDVDYAVADELLGLLVAASGAPVLGGSRDGTMLADARAAILTEDPGGLLPLADRLGVSPYRLSRAFPRELGVTVTQYRNRVRVGRAIDRIADGERDLAALAVELGYADQAHLSRVVRTQVGRTPGALRALLQGSSRPTRTAARDCTE
ncbi:helix-turn-helix domain-containing protein [Kibdelosporangium phytohabitans]|uniref:helix-turn-helix domain-containing protein n=1 Tax=Kibdelosporangium phytohabitans TaxID=860235 RepID=UPI0019F778A7|nr:AraC family transcriptional regulator [Kibdelosporangium phytohabitans]MBE1469828.1 AraC-like DNA-binding protein [Kibdelosporangium phytohabitans]